MKKKAAVTFAVHVSQVRMIPDKQLTQALVNRIISSREALAASNCVQLLCNGASKCMWFIVIITSVMYRVTEEFN